MVSLRRALPLSALCLLFLWMQPAAQAQPRPVAASSRTSEAGTSESKTARAFEAARSRGPLALYAFLYGMPKGGDLHNHLSGAGYAESWIRAAGEDHLCVDVNAHAFVKPPEHCEAKPEAKDGAKADASGRFPADALADNQPLYDALVDAFSMRGFVPRTGESGHDHFFDTFDKFGGTSHSHMPEWLDEVAGRAADQNEQYLELMHTPSFAGAAKLVSGIDFTGDYAADRKKLLAAGLRGEVPAIVAEMEGYLAAQRSIEHCGTPAATPACAVSIRFIYQVLRNLPPPLVFAQILLGFEVSAADPKHFLAINLVQPEDDFYAMRDYHEAMKMIGALRPLYPGVHVTLHAGELAPGLVAPEGLRFHIRDAVETAGAERIGHGVDAMYEENAPQLLEEMAAKHVMVEINLTSNAGILGVEGKEHPLPSYLAAGVPVALSTDDEGVNRSNMTHEYTRAALTYALSYSELKDLARNSIAYSFLPGAPLWPVAEAKTMYRHPAEACAASWTHLARDANAKPDGRCGALLDASEKARQQWKLEQRFAAFEAAMSR